MENAETVHVEVARTAERDELLRALTDRGVAAHAVDDDAMPAIEVPCGEHADRSCEEVFGEVEAWIAESGVPLVPELAERAVFLRPPAS